MGLLAMTVRRQEQPVDLFAQAGAFLRAHRLSPHPANYALAHANVVDPDGPLATEILRLTQGGLRLSVEDVVRLGGVAQTGVAVTPPPPAERTEFADALVARTRLQVDGFRDTVHAMSVEAQDFGRDLAATLADHSPAAQIGGIVHLASAMIERARIAESRLASATREADELRAALDEARGSARRDPLTDLPNRRAFDEAYAALDQEEAALAICDIDRFKQVNDRFGHAVGDRVLKAIGASLAESCPQGFVARFGGEEFVMIFPTLAIARGTLEETRERAAQRRLRVRETDEVIGAVTFSAGLTGITRGEPLEAALVRADAALYAAKQAGRNCMREIPNVGG
jgi:diguanylate cyclase